MSISDLRRDYAHATLDERDVDPDPFVELARWLEQALAARVHEPNAMTLATATRDGAPSARIVLLRGCDARGLTFFTDYRSRKGAELSDNPRCALVFYWPDLERQVRITGAVERLTAAESEAYYRSRPQGSQLGAWASHQSAPIASRAVLEERLREVAERFADGEVPLPAHWGGFRVVPEQFEFWQGRPSRLHDRIRYTLDDGVWRRDRLSP
jgi:pyridoxamine 5'-phosphate oxidase